MSVQPVENNSVGAILTIGMVVNSERVAVVEPWVTTASAPDLSTLCQDLVQSWQAALIGDWKSAMSEDGYIAFLQGEGMQDGRVPYRIDFAPADNPGGVAEHALPTSVCGLGVYYEDPADSVPGDRLRIAKTFFPAVPEGHVTGQTPNDAIRILWNTYLQNALNGIPSALDASFNWFRVLSVPKPRATVQHCRRVISTAARGYVAVQRRRLLPR